MNVSVERSPSRPERPPAREEYRRSSGMRHLSEIGREHPVIREIRRRLAAREEERTRGPAWSSEERTP